MTSSLIAEKDITTVDSIDTWEEAIKLAGKPLIQDQVITETYIENMITSVNENGPYMVLTEYFALMHARPGEGVRKSGMSLLVTKDSVDLRGKPVKIFLVMAAVDNTSHLESLQQIMQVFMDSNNFQTILSGDKEKITKLFSKEEKS